MSGRRYVWVYRYGPIADEICIRHSKVTNRKGTVVSLLASKIISGFKNKRNYTHSSVCDNITLSDPILVDRCDVEQLMKFLLRETQAERVESNSVAKQCNKLHLRANRFNEVVQLVQRYANQHRNVNRNANRNVNRRAAAVARAAIVDVDDSSSSSSSSDEDEDVVEQRQPAVRNRKRGRVNEPVDIDLANDDPQHIDGPVDQRAVKRIVIVTAQDKQIVIDFP